tara:strand:+ start:2509 stop:3153 length:645 start_codon:yes stop_codon:yes gene_type:complete
MTITEMHKLADLLIDKANAPWFTSEEKDMFINLAIKQIVDVNYREFEKNEEARAKLNTIVRTTNLGSVAQVDLTAITDFRYTLALKGTTPDSCGNLVSRKISPVQWDDEAGNQNDPFNKNSDTNLGYVQENIVGTGNVLKILSDTTPTNVTLVYLKTPVDVDASSAPIVDCELPDSVHEEVVNLAVRKMLGTVESQIQYQMQANEIASENENKR